MAEYNGSVELISGIKQKNNGDYPLVDASAVQVDDTGERLNARLSDINSIQTARKKAFGVDANEIYTGAVLTIIDDDGTTKFLTDHVPVYKAHGVTATTAVIASRARDITGTTSFGDAYEAMSFAQLRQLMRDGFDVQSHTWSHDRAVFNYSYNGSVTDAQIDDEFRKADELFRAEGIDCCLIAYPWGASNIQERVQKIARRYARFGVYISRSQGQNIVGTNPMSLNRQIFSHDGTNIADVKAAINTAVRHNAWVIVMTHAGAGDPDVSSLDELLTYAESTGIRIENFANAARLKAPVYYAGSEGNAFYVYPDGTMSLPSGVSLTLSNSIIEGGENAVKGGAIYTALSGKADKVAVGTPGNVVTLGANGNVADSGIPADTGMVLTSTQSLSSNERRIARENIGFRETHAYVDDGIDLSTVFTPAQFTGALAGGDFSNIFVGDYWTVTLNGTFRDYGTANGDIPYTERTLTNVPIKLEVGAIGQYRYLNQGELASGAHHVLFISRDCLPTLLKMGRLADFGVTDWNSDSKYAWDYSALKKTLNDPDYGIIKLIQATDIGAHIYVDNGSRGGLFLPTEHEVFGSAFNASGSDYGDEFPLQLPVFRDTYMHLIKKSGNSAAKWLLSAPKASDASKICAVSASGAPTTADYTADCGVPLCFLVLISFGWTRQPSDTTVVRGFISGALTAEAEAGSGSVTYQWYSSASTANTGGNAVSGAMSSTFTIPANLTEGDYYYYCVATAGDRTISSTAAKVTVNPLVLSILTQPQDTEYISGYISGNLSCAVAANVSTPLAYQWYQNDNDSNTGGTAISGATFSYFVVPTDLEVGSYYYYCVAYGGDESITTNAATVTVSAEPAFEIVTQPSNQYGVLNSTVTFSIVASGLGLTYRWQWFNGSSWADTSSTTDSTDPIEVITARNARRYRCIVGNSAGASITSSEARLYVSAVTISTQPQSAQIDVGGTSALSVTASTNDNSTLTYQWYLNGAAIPDAAAASYTTPNTLTRGSYSYTCTVANGTGATAVTNAAVITVGNVTYTQLGSITATNNTTPPAWFVANLAAGTYNYKLDVGGAKTSNDTAILIKQASSGSDSSGAVIVSKTCSECTGGASFAGSFTVTSTMPYLYMKYTPITVSSFTAVFSVSDEYSPVSTVTITSQPQSAQIDLGATSALTVAASSSDNSLLSYQWYLNGDILAGATSASYTTPASLSYGSYSYTCTVTNGSGVSATSDAAVITVGNMTYRQLGSITTSGNTTAPSWFAANLAAGTYGYKLDVGGSSSSDATAILVKQASSNSDASGTTIVTKTCVQCNGGASFTGTFTVTGTTPYIYMKYTPFTASTYTASFSILED